ncbi:acyl-CoA thioester hydrolase [Salana multivorans]|uniref:Acyl-CoA thioester hydrolase n=1 Tax=Salana multivorans TaxID=120377 RepID=A0A3N2DBC9_9MICO|nr:thioesterase family protein [Salana multivorans]ROR96764.1 acyl-CoA thioester hydrolase [Salana multivorans]
MGSRAVVVLPVRWSDVDLFGHVNNAAFLRFLDDARFAAFPGMGVDDAGEISESVLVVVKHEIDYLAPVRFTSEPLAVEVWVSRVGTSSVDFGYEIGAVAADGPGGDGPMGAGVGTDGTDAEARPGAGGPAATPFLRALSRMVQIDRSTGRPRPFDDAQREVFAAHTDEPPPLRGW